MTTAAALGSPHFFSEGNGMRARWHSGIFAALFALVVWFPAPAVAQHSNTFYVDEFPGKTVGEKLTAAQNACNPALQCVIEIDSKLAAYPTGNLPLQCASCTWVDWRSNPFAGLGGGGSGAWGSIGGNIANQSDLQSALALRVPVTRAINGHVLSGDFNVSASDVGLGGFVWDGSNGTVNGGFTAAASSRAGNPTTGARAALPSGTHGFACDESSSAGVPAAGVDYIRCDATTHKIVYSTNGSAETPLGTSSGGPATLTNSVLGASSVALVCEGTSIDRGYSTPDPWGPTNTANSGAPNDIQGGAAFNPQTTTALMGTSTWCNKVLNLPALKGKVTWVVNIASDGSWASNVAQYSAQARYPGSVKPLCQQAGSTYGKVLYAINQGGNDLYGSYLISYGNSYNQGEQTAAATYSVLDSLWTTAKADGCTVVAFTIPARTDMSAAADVQRQSLNNLIRASLDYDILVDLDRVLTDPVGGHGWSSDGVHWTTASHIVTARALNAALISGGSVREVSNVPRNYTPSSTLTCSPGASWFDSSYVYYCVASGTVKRIALGSY